MDTFFNENTEFYNILKTFFHYRNKPIFLQLLITY